MGSDILDVHANGDLQSGTTFLDQRNTFLLDSSYQNGEIMFNDIVHRNRIGCMHFRPTGS